MSGRLEKTTQLEQEIAFTSLEILEKSALLSEKSHTEKIQIRIQESREVIEIPLKAFLMLKSILNKMADGKAVTILSTDSELSTQEAADLLKVSRPYFVKLLESGKMPYKKIGTHRRVYLKDLLTYKNELQKQRRENLSILAKEAQDLNLGYE